ncbi:MAG TPA: DUF6448 family protein [Methanoregulaceae archaeon]|nr:DUF6448 family protein [Methanoregulaceae archaeon]
MTEYSNVPEGPVMRAAKMAIETGNPKHILVWIPEESENTLKNLLERVCCERTLQNDAHNPAAAWYYSTIRRLHATRYGPQNLDVSLRTPEEKRIILIAEKACMSGNFDEITTVVQNASWGEMRQCFQELMKLREYDGEDTAAGRAYVSALAAFVAMAIRFRSGSR